MRPNPTYGTPRRRGELWLVPRVPRVVVDVADANTLTLSKHGAGRLADRETWRKLHVAIWVAIRAEEIPRAERDRLKRFGKRLHDLIGYNPTLGGDE